MFGSTGNSRRQLKHLVQRPSVAGGGHRPRDIGAVKGNNHRNRAFPHESKPMDRCTAEKDVQQGAVFPTENVANFRAFPAARLPWASCPFFLEPPPFPEEGFGDHPWNGTIPSAFVFLSQDDGSKTLQPQHVPMHVQHFRFNIRGAEETCDRGVTTRHRRQQPPQNERACPVQSLCSPCAARFRNAPGPQGSPIAMDGG